LQASQTIRTTFNKGLITEASELNFPNEASVDELNCSLAKGGSRSKRLGIEYEAGYQLSTETYLDGTLFGTQTWENVGGDPDLEYLVVQTGNKLRFYQKGIRPLSSGEVPVSLADSNPYILDLSAYAIAGGLGAGASHITATSLSGHLIIVSPQIDAIYLTRNNTTGVFSVEKIDFRIRDFSWLSDPEEFSLPVPSGSVTQQRMYDTLNAGWVAGNDSSAIAALNSYVTATGNWPPLTHPWYSGKNSVGNFDPLEWGKVYSGTSRTANGHYILDLFNQDRLAETNFTQYGAGVTYTPYIFTDLSTFYTGEPVASPTSRFSSCVAFAGRVFYAGIDSKIYFTQIIEDVPDFGSLYQVNDPTAEDFSDLLDTDGGWVNIPEAVGINKLHVFGPTLLVFAQNGVWRISGVDDVFRASEFSVYKVTSYGLATRKSFASGPNGQPFWWSYVGIHSIQVTDQGGMVEVNLSRDTIKGFLDNISSGAKAGAVSIYDALNNRVMWMYPDNDETIDFKLNNVLLLDLDLGAFYPWRLSDTPSATPQIVGASFYLGRGASDVVFNVVDGDGNQVVDGAGNNVVVTKTAGQIQSTAIQFLVKDSSGSLSFAELTADSFLDWNVVNYEAYAESAYNFIGDLGRRKVSPYITVFMKQTETGWTLDGDQYVPLRQSSLKVSAYWDFKTTPATAQQQAYRLKEPVTVDPSSLGTFEYPSSVLSTRLKLRGRGKVVKIRFEGEEGKDFNLVGWETLDARKPSY
jgi:hypothetical protein